VKIGKALASAELVHRQVNPNFVKEGRITSEAFQPTKKDKGLLSVNRGEMCSAEEAHRTFVSRGWSSWGTLTVAVSEVTAVQLAVLEAPLDATQDPEDLFDDITHAVIDFRSLDDNKKQIEKRARTLRDNAVKRGAVKAQEPSSTLASAEPSPAENLVPSFAAAAIEPLPMSYAADSGVETRDAERLDK
jgi:hypothetical protein